MPPLKESVHHLSPLNLESQMSIYFGDTRLVTQSTSETPIIRANRPRFREWLSTKIPIQWGKRVESVEEDEGGVRVRFEDGTTVSGDILVGADGVNSIGTLRLLNPFFYHTPILSIDSLNSTDGTRKVREHVLQRPNSETLSTFPAAIVVGETTLSGKLFENQLALGHSCYAKSGPDSSGYFFFCGLNQVNADGNSGRYYWFVVTEDHDVDKEDHWLRSASQVEKLEHAIRTTSTLEPKFSEVIRSTPVSGMRTDPLLIRDAMIHDLPVSRITLLGDAMHPMTPCTSHFMYNCVSMHNYVPHAIFELT